MLFDLRGAGRRRTVRVLYVGLAVLIGGGLVFLGIGGGAGSSGLLTAAEQGNNSGHNIYAAEVKKYREQTKKNPTDAAAWAAYTKALLHEANGEALHTTEGTTSSLTSKGTEVYSEAAQAWETYVRLEPHNPSSELAELVIPIFAEEGLNRPTKAVEALQLVIAARPPSSSLYGQLAEYAYKAGDPGTGDLAARKAVELAPASDRATVKRGLAAVKKETEHTSSSTSTTTTTTGAGG